MTAAVVVLAVVAVALAASLVSVFVAAGVFAARLAPFAVPTLRAIAKMRDLHLRDLEEIAREEQTEVERRLVAASPRPPANAESYTDEEIEASIKRMDELRTEALRARQMKDPVERLRTSRELQKSVAESARELAVYKWAVAHGRVAA